MIYLDNAAGTHPKPEQLKYAMNRALESFGANPGRGNYKLTRDTEQLVEQVRYKLAAMVNAPLAERMIFTSGATMSLNMAIFGLLQRGDHVLYSGMEHNASSRPIYALQRAGIITADMIPVDSWGYLDVDRVEAAIKPHTRMIVVSHASNVCGSVQPIEQLGELARRRGIVLLVDAAQSAGLLELDVQRQGISLLALAGHKALYGPSGIGGLYVAPELDIGPLLYGGTGAQSELPTQPQQYPQHLEAGSLNVCGIAGWSAALDFVREQGVDALYAHAMSLCDALADGLREIKGVQLQLPPAYLLRRRVPVLSFTMEGHEVAKVAKYLDEHGICVRAGYQCSPLAHMSLGTFDEGSLRLSPGYYNTTEDVAFTVSVIEQLSKS